MWKVGFLPLAVVLMLGCAGQPNDFASPLPEGVNIPDWVLKPFVKDGLAASDCVKFSGNLSIDQKLVVANARAELAKQLTSKVEVMDSVLSKRDSIDNTPTTSNKFAEMNTVTAMEMLVGSKPEVFGFADIQGQQHYCTLVSLATEQTQELFGEILKLNKLSLDKDEQSLLWQNFIADTTKLSLEKNIARLTN